MGMDRTVDQIKDTCTPVITNADLNAGTLFLDGNPATTPDATAALPANPCGLIAKSVFTDTYSIVDKNTLNAVTIDETNIAWKSDIKYKYKNGTTGDYTTYQWLDVTDRK